MSQIREEYLYVLKDARGLSCGFPTCVPADELGEWMKKRKAEDDYPLWDGVAARAATIHGSTVDTMSRRIASTVHGYALLNDLAIADSLVLAMDSYLDDTGIPILPSSMVGAERLVDAMGYDLTEDERLELIHRLLRFTHGYITGPMLLGDEDAVRRAEGRLAATKKKQERTKKTGPRIMTEHEKRNKNRAQQMRRAMDKKREAAQA